MSVRGRFAPTPSGPLHLGNARTALVAWLSARAQGGTFVMRVEDLDEPRTVPEAVEGNLDELAWLGLDWDEGPDLGGPHAPYLQSRRHEHYQRALERLMAGGQVFPCYLSRRDLRHLASAPHGRGPVYGPRQRAANEAVRDEKIAGGKDPSLRLRVEEATIAFVDRIAGPQSAAALREVGDIVLRRADGVWSYHLAVVVDDLAMEIDEVVRGDDLLPSTAAQILLYRALGGVPPEYVHLPMLLDRSGQRMAKRRGSLTLRALWQRGVAAERVVGWLAYGLGLQREPMPRTARSLLPDFLPARLERRPTTMTDDDMAWLGAEANA